MSRRDKEDRRKKRKEQERSAAAGAPAPAAAAAAPAPRVDMSKELIERELHDPERLVLHLRRLSELLTIVPDLRGHRFEQEPFLEKLLSVDRAKLEKEPAERRPIALRQHVLAGVATEPLAKALRSDLQKTLQQAKDPADRIALFAGLMLTDSWLRQKGPPEQNPIWDALFGLSTLDLLFEGWIVTRVVRDALSPDEGNAAKLFTKALAKGEVSAELDKLGLDTHEGPKLATRFAELVRDRKRSYLLGFDSLLHLVKTNAEVAQKHVNTILAEGISPEVRKDVVAAFDAAYSEDVTKPLVEDLASEVVRRLETLDKEIRGEVTAPQRPKEAESPADERKTGVLALLALRALSHDRNPFLRATYCGSFEVYRRAAPVDELPFVQRIWQDPSDRWALEEFEKFLLTRRHMHRAARVRRFLDELRKAKAAAATAAPPEAAKTEGGAPPK